MLDLLRNYVTYNLWANTRILDKLATIDPDGWVSEQKSSFKSIRATLLHMCGAEMIWLCRLNGTSLTQWPADGFTGTNADAADMVLKASRDLVNYMSTVDEDELHRKCTYKMLSGQELTTQVSDMLQHCMNHATFHRGQIVTMLRNLDVTELPATDYIAFVRSQSQAA